MLHVPEKSIQPSTDGFRAALRQVVGQVSIVTAGIGDDRSGLVATSAISLSIDPPMMLVCVNRGSSTHPLFERYNHFGINILAPDQQPIAERFSGISGIKGAARYALGDWTVGVTGAPLLRDATVALDCEIEDMIEKATHSILIGRVRSVHQRQTEAALAYWRGRYVPLSA